MKGKVIFREEQCFKYTWSWWVLLICTLPMVGGILYGFYMQLYLGEPIGDHPASDTGLVIIGLFTCVLLLGLMWLFQFMRLTLEVDNGSIRYSFFPFIRSLRSLQKRGVHRMVVRKYHPIAEYGGWGYRFGFRSGRALTVSGKWGLQLELANGKQLLLGTQKPGELQIATDRLKQNWGSE